jgi:hypothetical protein
MSASAASSAPYGPGTPLVRRFLVQLAGLGAEARHRVVANHAEVVETAAFAAAEVALGETIERAGRTDARDALAGPLLQLVRRVDSAAATADELATLDPIAEPALAALLALIVADLLPADEVGRLYAPFNAVIPYHTLVEAPRTS